MQPTTVTVLVETDKSARIEGARQLGVQPEDVNVVPVDEKTYAVSIKNMPGQFDIAVSEDKMEAAINTITPPLGNGKPVAVEDIEHALADLKIIFGIDKKIIKNCVSEVINTGTPCKNIQVAVGEPPKSGQDGRIDLKIGRDAVNKDPNSNMMVKHRQKLVQEISETEAEPVEVKVNKAVYSGTTIIISGHVYHVKEDIKGKTLFVFNEEQQAVDLST